MGSDGTAGNLQGRAGNIPSLDGLRGIAALVVVGYHAAAFPTGGVYGVDIFFALSGFLITGQIVSEHRRTGTFSFSRFYGRRLRRLLPAFLLMYGLYMLIRAVFAPFLPSVGPVLLADILLLTNFNVLQLGYNPVTFLAHLWSISIEWQFYFVWPLIVFCALASRLPRWVFAAATLAAVAGIEWLRAHSTLPFLHMDGLLLGSLLAVADVASWSFLQRVNRAVRWVAGGAVFVGAACMTVFGVDGAWTQLFGLSVMSWVAMLAVFVLVAPVRPAGAALLESRPLRWLGKVSYGLYLYHYPIFCIMFYGRYSKLQILLVVLPLSLILADMSERYVEGPIRRFRWPVPAGLRIAAPETTA